MQRRDQMIDLYIVSFILFVCMILANGLAPYVYDYVPSTKLRLGIQIIVALLTYMVGILLGGML